MADMKMVLLPAQRNAMVDTLIHQCTMDSRWPDRVMVNVARGLDCKPPVKRFRGILPVTRSKLRSKVLTASVNISSLSDAQVAGYHAALAPVL